VETRTNDSCAIPVRALDNLFLPGTPSPFARFASKSHTAKPEKFPQNACFEKAIHKTQGVDTDGEHWTV
jgi:hypothetical protein